MKSLPPEALYKPIPLFLVLTFQIIYEYHRSESGSNKIISPNYTLCIPLLSKNLRSFYVAFLVPPIVDGFFLPSNLCGKSKGLGKNLIQQPKMSTFRPLENLPYIHHPLSKVSFLPPSNSSCHVITLYKFHL